MSLAANAIGERPIGADTPVASTTTKAPRKRTATAAPDPVQQPEAR